MAVGNSLVENKEKVTLTAYLSRDVIRNQINSIVGGAKGQRFISSIVSAVSANPELAKCENSTIVSAALLGAALELSPSPQLGQYYMVPFNNNKKGIKEAQFQLGYKGYIQLALRSGQYRKLNVMAIKEGELIRFNPLDEEIEVKLIEDEEERENTSTIGYYAMFEYTNGFKKAMYWSRKKMEAHATKYSPGYRAKKGYTFWEKDFDGMAYKTMLRQLISKWGIMSIDMVDAMDADYAVIKEDGTKDYVEMEENVIDAPETNQTKQEVIEEQMVPEPVMKAPEKKEKQPAQSTGSAADILFGGF